MPVSPEQVAATAVWVDQMSSASDQLQEAAAGVVGDLWLSFTGWYDRDKVARVAREAAAVSVVQQQRQAGIAAAYTSQVVGVLRDRPQPAPPKSLYVPIRNGADLPQVHTRPAQAYLRGVARGLSHEEALALAGRRAVGTLMSDLTLQERIAQQTMLDRLGITEFRRVIHPELSRTGTCGLCVAASGRVYKTGDLMPMHPPTCKCTVAPIIGDQDPGRELNNEDLGQLYEDAGSTSRKDLARTRYAVAEHGELGPVLVRAGDEFRDQQKARLQNDPERARAMLRQALPVLAQYEAREESGEEYAKERLDYQRKYVAMLQRYAGDVAA